MKKQILSILGIAIAVIGLMTFSSCSSDPCEDKDAAVLCNGKGSLATIGDNCGCDCDAGYEGTDCATLSNAKLIGSWTVVKEVDAAGDAIPNDPKTRVFTPNNITNFTITNFSGISGATINGSIDGNNLTFDGALGTYEVRNSSGKYSTGLIELSYDLYKDGSKIESYTGIWQK